MAGQACATDTPRHLSIEDNGTAAAGIVNTSQTVSPDPIIETPQTDTQEPLSSIPTKDMPTHEPAVVSNVSEARQNTLDTPAEVEAAATSENTDDDLSADPSENINRKIFAVNEALDKVVTKPVAKGYKKIVPVGIRRCVSNMFDNLGTPYTAVNNVLQGKVKSAGQDVGRVIVNSVLGIGGCFDVATKLGIPKHEEDFGQTLAVWGVGSGRFVMLPGFGPSTVRDALTKPVDILANPIRYITNIRLRNSLTGYKFVDTRTNLLEVTDTLDESALDKYSMVRDAWLQRRAAQIRDEDGSYDSISTDKPQEPKRTLTQ
ncbi:MAG: mlaA [Burkholderiaceae bacterium]|nr:mlaA [Burkholderiaceae bacterium]